MHSLEPLFFLPVIILIAVLGLAQIGRGRGILERWAARNGYRLIEVECRWLFRGRFSLTTNRGQQVYRVTVEDANGRLHRGYVRCGGFVLGLWSDRADAVWDAEPVHRPGFPVVMPDQRAQDRR